MARSLRELAELVPATIVVRVGDHEYESGRVHLRRCADELERQGREPDVIRCPRCDRDRPSALFRRRNTKAVTGGPDIWCRSCERDHWPERVGTVELMRRLPASDGCRTCHRPWDECVC